MDNNNIFFSSEYSCNNDLNRLDLSDISFSSLENKKCKDISKTQSVEQTPLDEVCEELVDLFQDNDIISDLFFENIEKQCQVANLTKQTNSINYFSNNFTFKEINDLLFATKCYVLTNNNFFQEIEYDEMIAWLGVNCTIELLSEEEWKKPFGEFFVRLEKNEQVAGERMQQKAFQWLCSQVRDRLTTDILFNMMQENFNLNISETLEKYREYFNEKSLAEKMTWILFVSTAKLLLYQPDGGMTLQAGLWPQKIKEDKAFPLIQLIDEKIVLDRNKFFSKLQTSRLNTHSPVNVPKFDFPIPIFDIPISKPPCEIPKGMMEWTPNGGSSCFILGGALWPLRFLREKEISLIMNDKNSSLWQTRQKCLEAFNVLYSNLAPESTNKTTPKDINLFRKEIQTLFKERFLYPQHLAQEDAHDFLRCLIIDLLQLPSCCDPKAPAFIQHHQYELLDEQTVNSYFYDIEEAKLPGNNLSTPLFQINLSQEKIASQNLADLIIKMRETEMIDRTIPLKKEHNSVAFAKCSLRAKHKEQYFVESKDSAPEYFIACLSRFYSNNEGNVKFKRFDCVHPDATIAFPVLNNEKEKVPFDLAAITIHEGKTMEGGHYYVYIRVYIDGKWCFYKYDDIMGVKKCSDEEVLLDAARNGYTFFYKKREEGSIVPDPLPSIEHLMPQNEGSHSAEPNISLVSNAQRKRKLEFENASLLDASAVEQKKKKIDTQALLKEASRWINKELFLTFKEGENVFSSLFEYLKTKNIEDMSSIIEKPPFDFFADILETTIYLIDPANDRDLFVDSGFPLPGDNFRFGESYNNNPVLYFYRTKEGYFVEMQNLQQF